MSRRRESQQQGAPSTQRKAKRWVLDDDPEDDLPTSKSQPVEWHSSYSTDESNSASSDSHDSSSSDSSGSSSSDSSESSSSDSSGSSSSDSSADASNASDSDSASSNGDENVSAGGTAKPTTASNRRSRYTRQQKIFDFVRPKSALKENEEVFGFNDIAEARLKQKRSGRSTQSSTVKASTSKRYTTVEPVSDDSSESDLSGFIVSDSEVEAEEDTDDGEKSWGKKSEEDSDEGVSGNEHNHVHTIGGDDSDSSVVLAGQKRHRKDAPKSSRRILSLGASSDSDVDEEKRAEQVQPIRKRVQPTASHLSFGAKIRELVDEEQTAQMFHRGHSLQSAFTLFLHVLAAMTLDRHGEFSARLFCDPRVPSHRAKVAIACLAELIQRKIDKVVYDRLSKNERFSFMYFHPVTGWAQALASDKEAPPLDWLFGNRAAFRKEYSAESIAEGEGTWAEAFQDECSLDLVENIHVEDPDGIPEIQSAVVAALRASIPLRVKAANACRMVLRALHDKRQQFVHSDVWAGRDWNLAKTPIEVGAAAALFETNEDIHAVDADQVEDDPDLVFHSRLSSNAIRHSRGKQHSSKPNVRSESDVEEELNDDERARDAAMYVAHKFLFPNVYGRVVSTLAHLKYDAPWCDICRRAGHASSSCVRFMGAVVNPDILFMWPNSTRSFVLACGEIPDEHSAQYVEKRKAPLKNSEYTDKRRRKAGERTSNNASKVEPQRSDAQAETKRQENVLVDLTFASESDEDSSKDVKKVANARHQSSPAVIELDDSDEFSQPSTSVSRLTKSPQGSILNYLMKKSSGTQSAQGPIVSTEHKSTRLRQLTLGAYENRKYYQGFESLLGDSDSDSDLDLPSRHATRKANSPRKRSVASDKSVIVIDESDPSVESSSDSSTSESDTGTPSSDSSDVTDDDVKGGDDDDDDDDEDDDAIIVDDMPSERFVSMLMKRASLPKSARAPRLVFTPGFVKSLESDTRDAFLSSFCHESAHDQNRAAKLHKEIRDNEKRAKVAGRIAPTQGYDYDFAAGSVCSRRVMLYHMMSHFQLMCLRAVREDLAAQNVVELSDDAVLECNTLSKNVVSQLYRLFGQLTELAERYGESDSRQAEIDLEQLEVWARSSVSAFRNSLHSDATIAVKLAKLSELRDGDGAQVTIPIRRIASELATASDVPWKGWNTPQYHPNTLSWSVRRPWALLPALFTGTRPSDKTTADADTKRKKPSRKKQATDSNTSSTPNPVYVPVAAVRTAVWHAARLTSECIGPYTEVDIGVEKDTGVDLLVMLAEWRRLLPAPTSTYSSTAAVSKRHA